MGLIQGACKSCWDKRRYVKQREANWHSARNGGRRIPITGGNPTSTSAAVNGNVTEAAKKHVLAAKRRRRARAAGRTVEQVRNTEAYIEVLGADVCAYCGGPADTIDHIDALSAGGNHVWDNLTAACRACNSTKHAASLLVFLLRNY